MIQSNNCSWAKECSSPPPFHNKDTRSWRYEEGRESKVYARPEEKEGMRCRERGLHPSCGLVQKPFVPIVLHNLFSQSLQREG